MPIIAVDVQAQCFVCSCVHRYPKRTDARAEIRRMRKQAVGGAADNKQGHRMDDTTVVVGFKVSVSNFQGRRVFQWLAGQEEGGAQH
jgi:hypothetical protein